MKNKWGPLNGGNLTPCRQLRYLFALSFHAARGEALLCCAWLGLSPIRCVDWRPAMQLSAAGECGAPWPCGLVVARAPLARLRRWCARRFFSATSSADIAPSCVQCAAVARSLCSVQSLAAACRCMSDGSTLYFNRHLAPSANTGN